MCGSLAAVVADDLIDRGLRSLAPESEAEPSEHGAARRETVCGRLGAARLATPEDLKHAKEILGSRTVMGFKNVTVEGLETGKMKAKARVTVAGYQQDVLAKEKEGTVDSPTAA